MREMLRLMRFEFKKMAQRKALWVSLLAMYILSVINGMPTGNIYVEGEKVYSHREYEQMQAQAGKSLEGAVMDQEFFDRYGQKYEAYLEWKDSGGYTTDNYAEQEKEFLPAKLIDNWKASFGLLEGQTPDVYESRRELLLSKYEEQKLSDREIAFHEKQIEEMRAPITYSFQETYNRFFLLQVSTVVFAAIAVVIGTAPLFSEEYAVRMDGLVLASKYGKKKTAAAKLLAGFSYTLFVCLLYFGSVFLLQALRFGMGNLGAAMQTINAVSGSSYGLSAGEALAVLNLCSVFSEILLAAVVMFFSAKMSASFGPLIGGMAFVLAAMLCNLFPDNMGLLSIFFDALPASFGTYEKVFNNHLVTFGSLCIPVFLAVPVLYVPLTWIFSRFAKRGFLYHQ